MKHLMIFAIGPVQEFIATARRSRDLWYGSWMLSELSRAAANEVVKQSGSLIFPSDPNNTSSVPNKIVATITSDPKIFADAVKAAIDDRMKKLGEEVFGGGKIKGLVTSTSYNKPLAEIQIKDLPELYWVSVLYNNNYKAAREEAEALLAARKVTRDFNQIQVEEMNLNVPKSSLDGGRESVIDENEYPQKKETEKDKEDKIRKLYDHYHARQGERLSGVDLLKRLGGEKQEPDFKSTSHMAAIPFIEKLEDKLGKAKTRELIKAIRALFESKTFNIGEKDDGALLYESRLTDWVPAGDLQKELRKEFIKILSDHLGDSRPSPYYALLAADGDYMGKVIDAQEDEETHRRLSDALSKFAAKAPEIVSNKKNDETDNKGLLIYSGGDDVLAYLPINKVLKCAGELEEAFRTGLSSFSTTDNSKTRKPTLSLGIVIAHHLDPLSDVLDMARAAETKAKEVDGKNGLTITLSKRSGLDRTISGKWNVLYSRLNDLIKFTKAKLISGGTAYELQELHRTLPNDFPVEGLQAEALRIVKHKQEAGGRDIRDAEKEIIKNWVKTISLDELANEMIIAKALSNTPEIKEQPEEVKA